MKAFDLDAAKRGEPVVTRDGRKVIDLHHFAHDKSELCLCAHIEGERSAEWFHANGRDNLSDEDPSDLFMAPKKRTVWLNFWQDINGLKCTTFASEDEARETPGYQPWTKVAVPVEIEE